MRRVPYFGAAKSSEYLSGLWSLYDHYQRKQKSQWVPDYAPQTWVRPKDWLPLPSIANGEEKFVGLFAVFPWGIGTQIGLYATGNYTVDWGDGTSPTNYSAGEAYHTYDFSSISSSTLTSEGYKQVIVTITPQAGQTISDLRFSRYDPNSDYAQLDQTSWLDINVNFANLTYFEPRRGNSGNILLQRIRIGPNQITDFSYMCSNARSLQSVDIYTKNGIYFNYMFYFTRSLTVGPSLDLRNAVVLDSMFRYSAIRTIPPYDLSKAQNVDAMFANSWIETVPPLTLPSATSANYMFFYSRLEYLEYLSLPVCPSATSLLQGSQVISVGTINAPLVTSAEYWFYGCTKLISVNNIIAPNVTNFSNMFSVARRLQHVCDLDTRKGTNFSLMFNETWILSKMPALNLSNATTTNQMFQGSGITMVPDLDISKATDVSYMFAGTGGLYKVGNLDCRSATNFNYMFSDYYSISTVRSIASINTTNATTMEGMFNSAKCLTEVPTGLNTGNVTTLQSAFAGTGITVVPDLNTSNCTNFQNTFSACDRLQKVGRLDLSKATNLSGFLASPYSVGNILAYGATISWSFDARLSKKNLEIVFKNLGTATSAAQTITITGNWGVGTGYNKTVTTTNGSAVLTTSDTSNLSTGMTAIGTGISDAVAVTFTDAGDTVNLTSHGLANGTNVSFSSITSTTGISTYTVYYVVNAAANTFQIAATPGGTALALTTNGSGNMLYPSTIASIVTNTSITLSAPAHASGTITATFRNLDTSYATEKGWTVAI